MTTEEKRTVRLVLRRLPSRESVADLLVQACTQIVRDILRDNATTFEELGITTSAREWIIEGLATSVYTQGGVPGFPRRLLPALISEQELQALFVQVSRQIPQEQIIEQCLRFLQQRPEIPYAPSLTTQPTPVPGTDDDPNVSEVSPTRRHLDRRTFGVRTRRDPRRTHRCDERSVSTDDVPT